MEEIERGAGSTFASEVVKALRKAAPLERAELDVGNEPAPNIKLA